MMGDREVITRYRQNRQDEVDSAAVYQAMAESESNPQLSDLYRRIAETEDKHAGFWVKKVREEGIDESNIQPTIRAKILAWLTRRFGPGLVLSTMRTGEMTGGEGYATQPEAEGTGLLADERSHDQLLAAIEKIPGRGAEGGVLARLEGRH